MHDGLIVLMDQDLFVCVQNSTQQRVKYINSNKLWHNNPELLDNTVQYKQIPPQTVLYSGVKYIMHCLRSPARNVHQETNEAYR